MDPETETVWRYTGLQVWPKVSVYRYEAKTEILYRYTGMKKVKIFGIPVWGRKPRNRTGIPVWLKMQTLVLTNAILKNFVMILIQILDFCEIIF